MSNETLNQARESLMLLRDIENDLNALYAVGYSLYNRGVLTDVVRGEIHTIRNETFALEATLYQLLITSIRVTVIGQSFVSLVPRPVIRPDLPPANLGNPPSTPLSPPATGALYTTTFPATDRAPGQTVNAVWALAGLAVVAFFAVVAIVGVVATQELFAFLRESRRLREETRRYLAQLIDSQARMQLCLDAGNSIEECFNLVPQPKPPVAEHRSGVFPWTLALGTVAVAGAAYWFFRSDSGQTMRERLLTS